MTGKQARNHAAAPLRGIGDKRSIRRPPGSAPVVRIRSLRNLRAAGHRGEYEVANINLFSLTTEDSNVDALA
jgi:hypothetical protein